MSKAYKAHGAKEHKGGGKQKVGPKPGPGAVKDAYDKPGAGAGFQKVQTQVGGTP